MQKGILKVFAKEENNKESDLEKQESRVKNEPKISLSNPPIPPNPPNSSNPPCSIIQNSSNSPNFTDFESNIESILLNQPCPKIEGIQSIPTDKENAYRKKDLNDKEENNKDKEQIIKIKPNTIVEPKIKSTSRKEKKNKENEAKIKEEANINKNKKLNDNTNFGNEIKKLEKEYNQNINFDFISSINQNYNDNEYNYNLQILLKENDKSQKEKDGKNKNKNLSQLNEKISEIKTRYIKVKQYFGENRKNYNINLEQEEEQEFNNLDNFDEKKSNDIDNYSFEGGGNISDQSQTMRESKNEMLNKKRKRSNSS